MAFGTVDLCLELDDLRRAAQGTENLMPKIIGAVKVLCTEGEITSYLAEVFGVYREPAVC
jgi:methylmalonyl-CoA mutase N-terminal domain/subunit